MKHLETEVYAISNLVDLNFEKTVSTSLTIYPTSSSSAFWKSWIFQESVRRTMIIAFFFLSSYYTLKEDLKYCEQHLAPPSAWTASIRLWNASSVNEFTSAWNNNRPIVVRNLDMTELIAHGTASDMDQLSRMFLVGFLGIDDARAWFQTRGGHL